jgi:urease accessory protein
VRGRAQLTAAAPARPGLACRIVRLQDESPVAWRCTPEGVYLVGTAATPVGDDTMEIDVAAEPGADLRIRSAAATVAWRSCGTVQQIRARVADGASLDWRLEPLIATAGCCHRQHAVVELQGSARLRWTEELLLGRYREQPGRLDLRLDVERDGRALLRHQIRIGSVGAWDGPAILGPYRTLGLILQVEPDYQPSAAAGPGWARLPLDGPAALTVAVAPDLPQLRMALAAGGGRGGAGGRGRDGAGPELGRRRRSVTSSDGRLPVNGRPVR